MGLQGSNAKLATKNTFFLFHANDAIFAHHAMPREWLSLESGCTQMY